MNLSPEIFNELKAISPLLAGLEKINVFRAPEGYFSELHLRIADYAMLNDTSAADNASKRSLQQVPSGYFDTLSDSILAKIKAAYPESAAEELRSLSPVLYNLRGNVFSVPGDYFETLAGNVMEKLGLQPSGWESAREELDGLSPMLSALKTNVFSVPEGYFENFAKDIVAKLKPGVADTESAEEELRRLAPGLLGLKSNIFSVPEGYFKNFAEYTMVKLEEQPAGMESAEEELFSLSPLLSSLKENVFSVPEGYFESFAANIVEKVKPQPAKVITMKKRSSWLKYAAAAVVTGAIAVSSLQIFNSSPGNNDRTAIATESGFSSEVKASYQYKTEDDLNAGIAKLSDDEIIKYLEKNGNIMDNELLTNDIDVSEMPNAADYLTDENTLNTYLDKLDADASDKSKP